jgi:hypothetical protein
MRHEHRKSQDVSLLQRIKAKEKSRENTAGERERIGAPMRPPTPICMSSLALYLSAL